MNNIQIFKFENQRVRTINIEEEVFFLGNDVARILGYSRTGDAVSQHVDKDDKKTLTYKAFGETEHSLWGANDYSNKAVVNESGLYDLIFGSKLPSAKKFKRWVTKEVLPSIRKNGAYATPETIESIIANPDFGIQLLSNLKEEKEKNILLTETIEKQKPQVVFASAIETSQNSIAVKVLATILKQNGIDIGQNRMFQWLRDNKYLSSRPGKSWNMPTQKSMDLGLFELKANPYFHSNGEIENSYTPLVTGKGQVYFVNKFAKVFKLIGAAK